MRLVGAGGQQARHYFYAADGTIASGGTAQLLLPQAMSRSLFVFQNISSGDMYLEFGSARATATLTTGTVSSCSVANAGFNFSKAPVIEFLGGGGANNSSFLGGNTPGYPAPSHVAKAHCVMTGSAPNMSVSAITVDDPGAGYAIAPYVFIVNSDLDPYGCAVPSASSGLKVVANGQVSFDATCCPTDAIAVYGAVTSQAFTARWME